MPTAVTKTVESSEGDSDDESEPLDVEVDGEGVGRGSATETDDSNDESGSDMESDDEAVENGGADPDDETPSPQSLSRDGNNWSSLFEEAKNFVASQGTMLVPFNHRLFPWLKEQAALYRRETEGEKKLLTAEQKERLQILGVDDFLESPVHKLRDIHVELAWIGEKSREKKTGQATLFDWEFIRRNASEELSAEMAKKETFGKRKNTKLPSLVGRGSHARVVFNELREEVRAALDSGVELKLVAGKASIAPAPPAESSDEESSEDEANVNARAYDSDDSSSVNLDEMAKNAAVDDSGSSSDSDSDSDDKDGMKIVSDVPDKWRLKPIEEEVAWLGEESKLATNNKTFDWDFIRKHASNDLSKMMEDKEVFTRHKHKKMNRLLNRMQNKNVKRNFDMKREEIRKKLARGYRRKQMKKVLSKDAEEDISGLGTAELSLWQDTSMPTLELTTAEEDLAWLLEEQAHYGKKTAGGVDWDYVLAHASPALKLVVEAKKVHEAKRSEKFGLLLRSTPGIKEAFDMKRSDIRKKLADGYRRSTLVTTPSKKSAPSTKTPTSRSKKSMNEFEIEVAYLVEESMLFSDSGRSDWAFIEEHASSKLKEHMEEREIFGKFKHKKLPKLVRLYDDSVARGFQQKRLEVRKYLFDGIRRSETKSILPKKPGDRWAQIFTDSSGLAGENSNRKRSATEAGLGDVSDSVRAPHSGKPTQELTSLQEELIWLMQESQFAKGITMIDWSFVEKHASKNLKLLIEDKKERNVKYRTVYAFFNIQSNQRLKTAYERKCSEMRELLESGHRRKGMEKYLPEPGGETARTPPRSAGKTGLGGRRRKRKSRAKPQIIEDGFLDSTQVSPVKGYEGGRKVSVRHSADCHPSSGNEWGEATLHTYIDIKKGNGGYSRQYKVRLNNGEFGWLGQDHVKSQDEPSASVATQQEESNVQSQGNEPAGASPDTSPSPVGPYGVYASVFAAMFPSETVKAALPHLDVPQPPPKEKAPREELHDLIGELRFQRENYRQEMRRQQDRFEAHTSFMERLEQKAINVVMKEDANKSDDDGANETTADVESGTDVLEMEKKVEDESKMDAEVVETDKDGGTSINVSDVEMDKVVVDVTTDKSEREADKASKSVDEPGNNSEGSGEDDDVMDLDGFGDIIGYQ